MKSILITGGTGSLGNALIARALPTGLHTIRTLSRGETLQSKTYARFQDPRLRCILGDVREYRDCLDAMKGIQVVIHAAALKEIRNGVTNTFQVYDVNQSGTRNIVYAARDAGVSRVVLISTDKAYNPISPYGRSKRAAEDYFEFAAASNFGPDFIRLRYGNVWGSRGSVGPKWKAEIEDGAKAINITDPRCTRFFMHMTQSDEHYPSAVDFVWDAMLHGKNGQLRIPVLPAYELQDLANVFSNIYGVEQNVIGLGRYEKLHESMDEGNCSRDARRMSVDELRSHL